MPLGSQHYLTANPFDAIVDPSVALAAHVRLSLSLGGKCVRWSPLDSQPGRLPVEDEAVKMVPTSLEVEPAEPLNFCKRLWP
jgi:hypothetical protein